MKPISNCRVMTKLFFLLFALFISGCFDRTPPARHYLLQPLESVSDPEQAPGPEQPLRIVVGPVNFPGYLNRPQMVFREGDNAVKIAQFDRWAEPLSDNFSRVLIENLTTLLNTDHVYPYPLKHQSEVDYQVRIDVYRFEAVPGKDARLIANWSVFSGEKKRPAFTIKTSIKKDLNSTVPSDIVPVLNKIVDALSREIAAEIGMIADDQ